MKFVVRPAFWIDVERHHLWLARNASADVADRWLEAVWRTVQFLQHNPELGRIRNDLRHEGVRTWLVEDFRRWTIFYGMKGDDLVLYRIEGGQRDLRRLIVG